MTAQAVRARNSVFWTLCMMGLFAILSSTMSKNPVLKPFASSLETPPELIGFVASASTIPGILISLPAASLSDIFGRKKFLLIAGFVFASAPFLYLLITVWWQLILVRFYHGFATAIFVPVAEASIAGLFPSKRGERISFFSSATNIGRVIAPTIGGYVLDATSRNFHMLYLGVGVAGLTALIMALPFLAERKETTTIVQAKAGETVKRLFSGWKIVITNRAVLIVGFVQACLYYVFGSAEFYLAGYLPEVVHLDETLTGIIITSIIAVGIFSRPYMGRVSDRVGRRVPIAAGLVISALPLFAIPFVKDFWVLLLLAMVYGFGFATVTASTPALVSELVPKGLIGASIGFLDMIMDVGQAIGPIISGFIYATGLRYLGLFPSLTLVLVISFVTFIISGVAKRQLNQENRSTN